MVSSSMLLLLIACVVVSADLVPVHVYLSLTGDATQMQVTFTTTSKPTTAEVTYWQYGSTSKSTIAVAVSDITEFKRPVTDVLNYISSVTLKGLTRAVSYNYQIVGDTANGANTTSKIFKFKHIPAAADPVTIAIYGDLGAYGYAITQEGPNGLKQWAASGKFDLVLHNGDLAYNLGSQNGAIGDDFMRSIEPVSSSVPYIVNPGNHEFMDDGHSEVYFNNFWAGQKLLGLNSKSANAPMWFSFDINSVHVVSISTEVYCEDTENIAKQHAWLENDLKTASARADKPWILVLGHRPLYDGLSSHLHSRLMRKGLQCDAGLKKCDPLTPCKGGANCAYSIEDLFTKYKVDMFNAGHEHLYRRNNPISANSTFEGHVASDKYINPRSPLYIISGAAGTAHTPVMRRSEAGPTPAVVGSSTYSFSIFIAHNSSAIHYQQVSAESAAILDNFWILKNGEKPDFKVVRFELEVDDQKICDQ